MGRLLYKIAEGAGSARPVPTRRSERARPARRQQRELAERKQRLEGSAAASGTLVTAGAADGRPPTQRREWSRGAIGVGAKRAA